MTLSDKGVIIKVVLIVLLIILFVVEFFTLFAAIIQMIIHDNNPHLLYDGILMTIAAIVVISLSFFGILGAVRENYLNLFVFAGVLGTILLMSLMIHLLLLPPNNEEVKEEDVIGERRNVEIFDDTSFDNSPLKSDSQWTEKKRSIHRMREDEPQINEASNLRIHSFSMDVWDILHQKFRCCGTSGPISWTELNLSIPNSCCHMKEKFGDPITENCTSNKGSYIYTEGCALFENAFFYSEKDSSSEVTLAVLMRVIGYLLQFSTVVLATWLGILILKSRQQEYDFHPKKDHEVIYD